MNIQLPQILFQIINFGVVVGALSYLLYRPIQKIFDERSQRINDAQQAAKETLAEREKLDEIAQESEAKAKEKAQAILEQAKLKAKEIEQDLTAKAEAKAAKLIEKKQQDWAKQQEQLAEEMRSQFADSVMAVVEKVLDKAFDKKAHTKLIDSEVSTILKKM